jgi:hypothetical protein
VTQDSSTWDKINVEIRWGVQMAQYPALLIFLCWIAIISVGYSILHSKDAVFKRKYFPLFIRAVVGIVAVLAILAAWAQDHGPFKFFGHVLFIAFMAAIAVISILLRYQFCVKCGATNRFYIAFRGMRTHCKKCGQPFDQAENKSLSDYLNR